MSISANGLFVREGDAEFIDPLEASISWWIIFICASTSCLDVIVFFSITLTPFRIISSAVATRLNV